MPCGGWSAAHEQSSGVPSPSPRSYEADVLQTRLLIVALALTASCIIGYWYHHLGGWQHELATVGTPCAAVAYPWMRRWGVTGACSRAEPSEHNQTLY